MELRPPRAGLEAAEKMLEVGVVAEAGAAVETPMAAAMAAAWRAS